MQNEINKAMSCLEVALRFVRLRDSIEAGKELEDLTQEQLHASSEACDHCDFYIYYAIETLESLLGKRHEL